MTMSRITQVIGTQYYELIRDRTLAILIDEFEKQFILTGDYELEIEAFIERGTPIDKTELSTVIVSMASGTFGNKNQGNVDGSYMFHIDFYTNSKTTSESDGGYLAKKKLHKLMGVGRAILEDPLYKTLGYTPPFIMKSIVSELNIAAPNKEDAVNTGMGRLGFSVTANESSKLTVPSLIDGYETQIKIDNTGKGYFYEGETYQ